MVGLVFRGQLLVAVAIDVGAKIGGPVKGVPASSLAGEDEGDGALC